MRKYTKDYDNGFLYNCHIMGNKKDKGPLFVAKDGRVLACLDGYLIAPLEDYKEFLKWKDRKQNSKIRVLNLGGK